ncbi:MAG TPA: DNA-directed RNA polymerase subunit omega [Chitinophagaceae bacterium]|jgi:DNA-directed RNA polymerase subunit K/omega|nr:DNA-directed RNA polymerase subunit omega [Chitinophagaceae bacterium]
MIKVRKQRAANANNVAETKNLSQIKAVTGNLYESIAVIAKRANQINIAVREELHNKLEEFVVHSDNLEEVLENKEQIEMSRLYERMPNPSLVATQEFLEDKVYFRRNDADLFQ